VIGGGNGKKRGPSDDSVEDEKQIGEKKSAQGFVAEGADELGSWDQRGLKDPIKG